MNTITTYDRQATLELMQWALDLGNPFFVAQENLGKVRLTIEANNSELELIENYVNKQAAITIDRAS